ncbi:hypothetical protein BC830DRAFT_56495 [Chytriomyces sp. MP71]|nr:hypothetical protein BC830DRAFT_56495 [Chytriomyces sp. MP71]
MSVQQRKASTLDLDQIAIVARKQLVKSHSDVGSTLSSRGQLRGSQGGFHEPGVAAPRQRQASEGANGSGGGHYILSGSQARQVSVATVSVGAMASLPNVGTQSIASDLRTGAGSPSLRGVAGASARKLSIQNMGFAAETSPFAVGDGDSSATSATDGRQPPSAHQPGAENLSNAARAASTTAQCVASVSLGADLPFDMAGNAPSNRFSPSLSAKRSGKPALPPLDPQLTASASALVFRPDSADTTISALAQVDLHSAGSKKSLAPLGLGLEGVLVEAVSLSNQYIDQAGNTGNAAPTRQTELLNKSMSMIPRPPLLNRSQSDLANSRKRTGSNKKLEATLGAGGASARRASGGEQKKVLPRIAPKEEEAVPTHATAIEEPVLNARELAKRRAMEKNIWRYSKLDETKRLIYLKNS